MRLIYDAISPITNRRSVLIEYDERGGETRLCMDTGYYYQEFTEEGFEETLPQFVIDNKIKDDEGREWFKLIITSPTMMLFPDEGDVWKIVSLIDTEEGQIPTFVWGGREKTIDPNSIVEYDNFSDAFDNFNVISNLNYE